MDEKTAKEIVNYAFKDIFGRDNPFSLDEIKERFAYGIELPRKVKDSMTGGDAWVVGNEDHKVINSTTFEELAKKDGWMKPKKEIKKLDDALKYWDDIAYFPVERLYKNATDCYGSDHVYASSQIYCSAKIEDSQKMVFCNHMINCKYQVASSYTYNSQTGLRNIDSNYSSANFAVVWCTKAAKCMYLSSCIDTYECILCANLVSKKYCIANMQFTKEEYMPIKEALIDWTIKNYDKTHNLGF